MRDMQDAILQSDAVLRVREKHGWRCTPVGQQRDQAGCKIAIYWRQVMSSTTETIQKITFRRYKDGDNKVGRLSEKIMQASFTHKCPTYIQSTPPCQGSCPAGEDIDRKSTRLNSSHLVISYAVFC